jgi:hypothetical protein
MMHQVDDNLLDLEGSRWDPSHEQKQVTGQTHTRNIHTQAGEQRPQPPIFSSSNPVQRPKKKRSSKRGKKRKKTEREREPKPRRTRRSKERSSLERAHPNPRSSSSSLASSPRAEQLPLPRGSPAALRAAGERNSSSACPRLGSANPRLLRGQLNSRCFSGPIRSPQVRGRRCRRSRLRELSPGQGSCLHCSRVWAVNSISARQVPAPTLDSGQLASPPARFLDFPAIGAAPVAMRSPPWLASWELGYGLTLCRTRRKP